MGKVGINTVLLRGAGLNIGIFHSLYLEVSLAQLYNISLRVYSHRPHFSQFLAKFFF